MNGLESRGITRINPERYEINPGLYRKRKEKQEISANEEERDHIQQAGLRNSGEKSPTWRQRENWAKKRFRSEDSNGSV